jgi:hypothetical protein
MTTVLSSPATLRVFAPDAGVPSYIGTLAPNAAYQIPNSDVAVAFQNFAGQYGGHISVFAYSGGAYDTRRGMLLISGGGHNDYNGNAVYGFSPYASNTPAWIRVRGSTSPPNGSDPTSSFSDQCPNGDPAASHTYYSIIYDRYNDALVLYGLTSYFGSRGVSRRVRKMNLTTRVWDPYTAHGNKLDIGDSAAAVYDDVANVIWGKEAPHLTGLQRMDVTTGGLTQVSDGAPKLNQDSAMAIDPRRRYIIAIGGASSYGPNYDNSGTDMMLWDLATYDGSRVASYSRALSGFPSALKTAKIACEFHPPSGCFVAWRGGNTIHLLRPPANPFTGTWTFETRTPTGGPLPPDPGGGHGGIYGRFRWAPYPNDPTKGVFVMVVPGGSEGNYRTLNTYIYKPDF